MTSRHPTDPVATESGLGTGAEAGDAHDPTPPPAAVLRWLDRVDVPTRASRTAVIEGSARFRRGGNGWWLPTEAVMWHELGRNHVVDRRMGLGPLTFARGLDGYVDEAGFSRISHTLDVGDEMDQAALLCMWSEALLLPAAWRDRDDVVWSAADGDSVVVTLTQPERPVVARLRFDPSTGLPTSFTAERYKGRGSRLVEWNVDYGDWRPTSDGVLLPSTLAATWADEPGPWFQMKIERANPDADVAAAIERGRDLLAGAADDHGTDIQEEAS